MGTCTAANPNVSRRRCAITSTMAPRFSAQQLVAADRRMEIAAFELQQCLGEVDAIVSPTTPHAAPAFGDDMPENAGTYCILANFARRTRDQSANGL